MNPDYGRLRQSKQKDCFEKEVNIERERVREKGWDKKIERECDKDYKWKM